MTISGDTPTPGVKGHGGFQWQEKRMIVSHAYSDVICCVTTFNGAVYYLVIWDSGT